MWNYVYFMVLINVKDPTEYTGPESYVHEMIKVRSCFFLIKKNKNTFKFKFSFRNEILIGFHECVQVV